ncbi:unnamed protein product [Owenia fusiformis]|uniref:Fucosyltransferase n=1 Tax=Owenia fusiformis TaxID=6347 RepID=A0A8S4QAL9_OWEFU|nr:unnamed protein product [Owenia fusiformis]
MKPSDWSVLVLYQPVLLLRLSPLIISVAIQKILVNSIPTKVLPDYNQGKNKLVAWIVSHCVTNSRREVYVKRLREHIPVDVYGGCGSLTCPDPKNRSACQRHVGANYKFYLAFENSDCRDYVIEKVWKNSITMNTVPVVRGYYNNFKSILPPGSYIHTNEFPNPKALATYLKYLDKNHTAYNEYFKWKLTYKLDSLCSSRKWGNGKIFGKSFTHLTIIVTIIMMFLSASLTNESRPYLKDLT